jgi:radical SAM protein with 4Fe4S-binding SPASM domain
MDKTEFLKYRLNQESIIHSKNNSNDPMASLVSVQFNTTELCNRTCDFCPRINPEIYPNRNLHMTVDTVDKITKDLNNIDYVGRISLNGFGEPLLTKNFIEIVKTIRSNLQNCIIDTNTSGDKLTEHRIDELYDAGIDMLYINLYDGTDQVEHFTELFKNVSKDKYVFRPHWKNGDATYNLILNNRGGTIQSAVTGFIQRPLKQQCYLPFSRAMVDYNGNLLLCSNDWSRNYIVGSLLETHIKDLWMGERIKDIRLKLADYNRETNPCNSCNTNGTLTGKKSYDILMKHYEHTDQF